MKEIAQQKKIFCCAKTFFCCTKKTNFAVQKNFMVLHVKNFAVQKKGILNRIFFCTSIFSFKKNSKYIECISYYFIIRAYSNNTCLKKNISIFYVSILFSKIFSAQKNYFLCCKFFANIFFSCAKFI